MAEFQIRPKAIQDIRKQAKFISRDGLSIADDYIDHIFDRFEILSKNPYMGRKADQFGVGLYVWPDRKYRTYIYYTIFNDRIIIERVIGMRMDQPSAF